MSYLNANLQHNSVASRKIRRAFRTLINTPVDDEQVRVFFKHDISGDGAQNHYVHVQGKFKDLCREFANAQRTDENRVMSAPIHQSEKFDAGSKKLGKLEYFS